MRHLLLPLALLAVAACADDDTTLPGTEDSRCTAEMAAATYRIDITEEEAVRILEHATGIEIGDGAVDDIDAFVEARDLVSERLAACIRDGEMLCADDVDCPFGDQSCQLNGQCSETSFDTSVALCRADNECGASVCSIAFDDQWGACSTSCSSALQCQIGFTCVDSSCVSQE